MIIEVLNHINTESNDLYYNFNVGKNVLIWKKCQEKLFEEGKPEGNIIYNFS